MKIVLSESRCKTVPAKDEGVDAELRIQAIGRAGKAKAVAGVHSDTGQLKGSIHVSKHEKGYSVDIDDPNAVSIIYGHEYEGWAEGHPRFQGHHDIIDAIFA